MPPTIFGNFRPDEYRDLEKQLAEQQRLNSELQNRNNALAVLSLQLTQQSDISDAAEDLIISAQQDAGSLSYLSPEEQARLAEVVKVQKIKELADKEKAQLIAEVTGQVNQLDFIESERQKILSDMQKDGSIDEITRKAKADKHAELLKEITDDEYERIMGLLNSEVIRDEIFNRGVGGLAEIIAKKMLYEGELSARDSDILAGVLEFINSPEGKMTKDQIKQSVAYDLDRIIKEKARRDIEAEEIRKKDIYLNYLAEFKDKGVNLSKISLNFTVTILCNFKTIGSYTYSVSTTSKRIELISRGSGILSLVNETEDINNLRLSRDMDIFLGSYIPEDGEMKLLPTLKRNSTLEIVFLARGDKEANAKTGRTSSELKVQDVIVEEVSGYKGLEPKSR